MATYKDLSVISDILKDYANDITDDIEEEAERVGRDSSNTLKHKSPKRSGRYARNWSIDVGKKYNADRGISVFSVTIYNKKTYMLTHLLEKEHLNRNGQPIIPRSANHIYDVEQKAIKDYEQSVERIIGGTQ